MTFTDDVYLESLDLWIPCTVTAIIDSDGDATIQSVKDEAGQDRLLELARTKSGRREIDRLEEKAVDEDVDQAWDRRDHAAVREYRERDFA